MMTKTLQYVDADDLLAGHLHLIDQMAEFDEGMTFGNYELALLSKKEVIRLLKQCEDKKSASIVLARLKTFDDKTYVNFE